jgi:hypothetical protein
LSGQIVEPKAGGFTAALANHLLSLRSPAAMHGRIELSERSRRYSNLSSSGRGGKKVTSAISRPRTVKPLPAIEMRFHPLSETC